MLTKISYLQSEINDLHKQHAKGLLSDKKARALCKKENELQKQKLKLRGLKASSVRQKKFRVDLKRKLGVIFEKNPELKETLRKHDGRGRPRLEESQKGLLDTIAELAIHGCGADERRRSEKIRTVRTLDGMKEELENLGFSLSRSALYLRLLPKNSVTIEGKKHIKTVPVRLLRAENNLHDKHSDTAFCTATIRGLEEVASLLGPEEVSFLSQDAKARVPIGITAANKQAPLMMHLEYKVTLPDHDYVKAPGHKLVPDVYAGIKINAPTNQFGDPKSVSYSGPTYIAIRSAKHTQSTAFEHLHDIKTLTYLPEFENIMLSSDRLPKPIRIITCDGGPDENPRYEKTIDCAIEQFQVDDLDALFIATNAPGRSAFNRVERRMAPLSRELSGVLLPHDHYGTHLDSQGRTTDPELELKNFAHAGQVLSEIWSATVIDGHSVKAVYIQPEVCSLELPKKSTDWKSKHVRESQYFLQIIKCTDAECCTKFRSSYLLLMNNSRFLPPPLPLNQSKDKGLSVFMGKDSLASYPSIFVLKSLHKDILPRSAAKFKEVPYDFACPSVQDKLTSRVCKACGLYHASVRSLKEHTKACKKSSAVRVYGDERLRPLRIAARRQRELMCVIKYLEEEVYEWHSEEDIIVSGEVPESTLGVGTPIIEVKDMNSPWVDE